MSFVTLAATVFGLASVGYLFVAGGYWSQGRPGLTAAFLFYVCANAGFIYDMLTYKQ